ncbi:MAG: PepSY domain-containing protein [Anaerolineae bacterium]|nr:PepSY domain-containing protein [Anaerolineae bacterium]
MNNRMVKRVIKAVSWTIVSLLALLALTYGYYENHKSSIDLTFYEVFLRDSKPEPSPGFLSGYSNNRIGYYQFNSQTILASLEQGKTDVFARLAMDPRLDDPDIEYDNIAWTQADFLRVASALSQKIWNEPLDLDGWAIYSFYFIGHCSDTFGGFNDFHIVYYKTIKIGWETVYSARYLTLTPWRGTAVWAGDGEFSELFIFPWGNIELTKFKTTAEQAVQIANKNGGKVNQDRCRIRADIRDGDWRIEYETDTGLVDIFINPFSGKVESKK